MLLPALYATSFWLNPRLNEAVCGRHGPSRWEYGRYRSAPVSRVTGSRATQIVMQFGGDRQK